MGHPSGRVVSHGNILLPSTGSDGAQQGKPGVTQRHGMALNAVVRLGGAPTRQEVTDDIRSALHEGISELEPPGRRASRVREMAPPGSGGAILVFRLSCRCSAAPRRRPRGPWARL